MIPRAVGVLFAAAVSVVAVGCGGDKTGFPGATSTVTVNPGEIPPDEIQGEIGERYRRAMVTGTDRRGRSWRMDRFTRPNGRECTDVTFPDISSSRRNGFCDLGLFDLSLGRFIKATVDTSNRIAVIGLVAPAVSSVDFCDANGRVRATIEPRIFDMTAPQKVGAVVETEIDEAITRAVLRRGDVVLEEIDLSNSLVLLHGGDAATAD